MKALTLISLLAAAALTPAVAQKREGRGPKIAKPRIEDTIKAFPNKSVANAEEARVSPAAASLASPRSVCRRL